MQGLLHEPEVYAESRQESMQGSAPSQVSMRIFADLPATRTTVANRPAWSIVSIPDSIRYFGTPDVLLEKNLWHINCNLGAVQNLWQVKCRQGTIISYNTGMMCAVRLALQPISWREACDFVNLWHSHHKAPRGWKYGIAVNDGNSVVGVVIVGRPLSRVLDDGWTLEVTRCCVKGNVKNAASMLYGASWRAAKALGYKRLITYTLEGEAGTSLIAAGWEPIYKTKGGSWNTPARPRVDKHPTVQKTLWEVT